MIMAKTQASCPKVPFLNKHNPSTSPIIKPVYATGPERPSSHISNSM